ncbi:alpha amylase C-terminal domain-containing protein [Myxococcota bacterium]|nr:alpha amylase C-terminal domain-containing protein [Myxococcota bacterium]
MIPTLLLACSASIPYGEDPPITNHVEDWRDEVIYQVIVDRFANGDVNNDWNVSRSEDLNRYLGGDYQGLIDRVDYLSALGVTTIWISPVVVNVEEDAGIASYHGYWTQDFTDVNPHFGDIAKLRELVDVMHQHDIKVLVDVVVNHVGQLFYYDINHNGQADVTTWYGTDGSDSLDIVTEWDPAYDERGIQSWTSLGEAGPAPLGWVSMPEINREPPSPAEFWNDEWYHKRGRVTDWSDLDQVVMADFPGGLKDLATENPNVRRALIEVFSDWITRTNVDGFRLDTVKHVEEDFWTEFCPAIRQHAASLGKERFLLMGEVFDGDDALVGRYTQPDMLDSVVDFPAKYQVVDGVFKYGGATRTVQTLYEQQQVSWGQLEHEGGVGVAPRDLSLNFMDNHDVARFLFDVDQYGSEGTDPVAALESALAWLLTTDGAPVLYYGTEQGFDGGNDPANREPLWWSGYETEGELFRWIAALSALRQAHEPLRRGAVSFTWTTDHTGQEEDAGMLAYERWTEGERVLVVINTHDTKTSVTSVDGAPMATGYAPGTVLVDGLGRALTGSGQTWTVAADGSLAVELPPRGAVVLVEG